MINEKDKKGRWAEDFEILLNIKEDKKPLKLGCSQDLAKYKWV